MLHYVRWEQAIEAETAEDAAQIASNKILTDRKIELAVSEDREYPDDPVMGDYPELDFRRQRRYPGLVLILSLLTVLFHSSVGIGNSYAKIGSIEVPKEIQQEFPIVFGILPFSIGLIVAFYSLREIYFNATWKWWRGLSFMVGLVLFMYGIGRILDWIVPF